MAVPFARRPLAPRPPSQLPSIGALAARPRCGHSTYRRARCSASDAPIILAAFIAELAGPALGISEQEAASLLIGADRFDLTELLVELDTAIRPMTK